MKTSFATFSLCFLAIVPCLVSAHGFVASLDIDGKSYTGNDPLGATKPSPIRKISTPNPNYGASNPALNCGPGAKAGSLVADAMPGSVLSFNWAAYPEWPHNTGPVITYLGNCGSTSSDKCDTTKVKWFKIHQDGRKSNGQWFQQDIMNGGLSKVTLPQNLAPGNYVVRHEIIALHLATTKGKAEFYPSCAQIKVGGNGNGVPSANELVSFPGGYSDNDPGIFTPQVFNTRVTYAFPGPPVVTSLVAGSGSSDAGAPTPSGGATSSAPAAGATGAPDADAAEDDEDEDEDSSDDASKDSPASPPPTRPVQVSTGSQGGNGSKGSTGSRGGKTCRRRQRREEEPEPEADIEAADRSPAANDTEVEAATVQQIRGLHARRGFGQIHRHSH